MAKIGDTIRITYMDGEPQYTGREGVVQRISKDPWGDTRLEGTWGGCAVYPNTDTYEIIKRAE